MDIGGSDCMFLRFIAAIFSNQSKTCPISYMRQKYRKPCVFRAFKAKKKVTDLSDPKNCSNQLPSYILVGEGGFEPPKALPADLQSVPFGHSGIPPYSFLRSPVTQIESQRSGFDLKKEEAGRGCAAFGCAGSGTEQAASDVGAGRRTRTPDLLITNQLLYQLSYTS